MEILIINSVIYWVTFIYFLKKYKFSILSFLWAYYAVFSVFGIFLLMDGLYFKVMNISEHRMDNITILPYAILYLSFLFITVPLKKVRYGNLIIDDRMYYNKKISTFCTGCFFFEFVYILIKIYQAYLVARVGFGSMHDMENPDMLLYSGPFSGIIKILNYIGRFITLVFMPFIVVYIVNGFLKKHVKKKRLIRCLFLYICASLAVGIVGGSRAQMFFNLMELMFFFILFKNNFSPKLLRYVCILGLLFSIIIVFITSQITVERFEEAKNMTPLESIYRYLGEMWLNLSMDVWDNAQIHPMGWRLFSSLIFDLDYYEAYWYYKTNVHTWWFKTFIGDLHLEFGTPITINLVLIIGLVIRKCLKKRKYELSDVGYIFFVYSFCVKNLFDFGISQTSLLVLILIFFFSRLIKTSIEGKYEK